jgi:hypothetical protein
MENMKKMSVTPHASKCGARTRPSGTPCRNWAMPNGRCRLHGGKSTGPRTVAGIERIRRAHWKHGWRSAQARQEHREIRELLGKANTLSGQIEEAALKGSISLDELDSLIEQESEIRTNLISLAERAKYITFKDRMLYQKYLAEELTKDREFLERLMNRPKSTPPSGSSTSNGYPKIVVLRVDNLTQKITLEEKW